MELFIGPISKNIVDTVIDFSFKNPEVKITLIPSRRQIEYSKGYVYNWRTSEFCEYVKNKNPNIRIERDHGGPEQGTNMDDGYLSLKEDCKYMDIIHIDPWKKYQNFEEGLQCTKELLEYCYSQNPNLEYEIGTEEAIRYFSIEELEQLIVRLKDMLDINIFNKIRYIVIQCGTSLCQRLNIGTFDEIRLRQMLDIADKYNLRAKEHNGDWVSKEVNNKKIKLGLKNINIAPELGEIESQVILDNIKSNNDDYENIFLLCLESNKWKKWVNTSFDPYKNKDEIILITCHYIYSTFEFQKIISKYIDIDLKIKEVIYDKLLDLNNL